MAKTKPDAEVKKSRLPDIERLPETTITQLAVRIIDHDDLSAVGRLVDALLDAGRDYDAKAIRRAVGRACWHQRNTAASLRNSLDAANVIVDTVIDIVWDDLFSVDASTAYLDRINAAQRDLRAKMNDTYALHGGYPIPGELPSGAGTYGVMANPAMMDPAAPEMSIQQLINHLQDAGVTLEEVQELIVANTPIVTNSPE